jgi:hypothetical protein
MKRRRRLVLVLIALTVAGIVCGLLWAAEPRVSRARMERVTKGMTYAEVVATVGGPPGDYTGGVIGTDVIWMPRGLGWDADFRWVCPSGELLVDFDSAGRANWVIVMDVIDDRPTLRQRLARLVGL